MLKARKIINHIAKFTPVWHIWIGHDKVALRFTPREIWLTVIVLNRFIFGTIKEMWRDWRWYKYEYYVPDAEKERKGDAGSYKKMIESYKRMAKKESLKMDKET